MTNEFIEFHKTRWYGYQQPFKIRRSEILRFEQEGGWAWIYTNDDAFRVAESYDEVVNKIETGS